MLTNLNKAPFPWFGGKRQAAPAVWDALGDVVHYVEPFCGSMAVLLNRPHEANRPYYSETTNDADGLLVNAWRGIQLRPDETVEAASNPVAEADLHARHLALVRWRRDHQLEHLMGDPTWCDPVMAGWWLWGCSCWIGGGWCSGNGPWIRGDDDRLTKRDKNDVDGGVNRILPSISDDGRGVNHAGTREPGVARQLPHISNDGQGVNRPGTREPVVCADMEFHPVTMPELRRWFAFLFARLRHVRILNGDWRRVCTDGALKTINVRHVKGVVGIFLDPPYADTAKRSKDVYAHDSMSVAHDVCEWALSRGDDPSMRIVVAGFEGEHGTKFSEAGWREVEWYANGHLRGGMANLGGSGKTQQHRERLWVSPHCLGGNDSRQLSMW